MPAEQVVQTACRKPRTPEVENPEPSPQQLIPKTKSQSLRSQGLLPYLGRLGSQTWKIIAEPMGTEAPWKSGIQASRQRWVLQKVGSVMSNFFDVHQLHKSRVSRPQRREEASCPRLTKGFHGCPGIFGHAEAYLRSPQKSSENEHIQGAS